VRHGLVLRPARKQRHRRHQDAGKAHRVAHEQLHRGAAIALGKKTFEPIAEGVGNRRPTVVDDVGDLVDRNLGNLVAQPTGRLERQRTPEEMPYSCADPPAASTRAAMSSTSRATAYCAESVLSPRPRRS
jgi:hypothetical protein